MSDFYQAIIKAFRPREFSIKKKVQTTKESTKTVFQELDTEIELNLLLCDVVARHIGRKILFVGEHSHTHTEES